MCLRVELIISLSAKIQDQDKIVNFNCNKILYMLGATANNKNIYLIIIYINIMSLINQ